MKRDLGLALILFVAYFVASLGWFVVTGHWL